MPQVNLSDLSGPELRRLLDATRGRGDAALSYTILQEMAARREGRGQRGLFVRRRAEPRVVAVNLGDPMEAGDDLPPLPRWRQPLPEPEAVAIAESEPPDEPVAQRSGTPPVPTHEPAVDVEPPPAPDAELSFSFRDADPEPAPDEAAFEDSDLRLDAPERTTPAPRRRRGLVPGLAVGIAVGVGLGWWLGGIVRDAPSSSAAAAPAPGPGLVLAAASPVPVGAEPEPAPEAPADPAVAPPPPAAEAVEIAGDAHAEPSAPPAPAAAEAAAAPLVPAANEACAAEPTPADREICGDPDLQRLQRRLRQAYAEALDAHQDRDLLRERQLAWKSARDSVSDPGRLAALYEERIDKLHAATIAARQQR